MSCVPKTAGVAPLTIETGNMCAIRSSLVILFAEKKAALTSRDFRKRSRQRDAG
jgi:hypothetical protein